MQMDELDIKEIKQLPTRKQQPLKPLQNRVNDSFQLTTTVLSIRNVAEAMTNRKSYSQLKGSPYP